MTADAGARHRIREGAVYQPYGLPGATEPEATITIHAINIAGEITAVYSTVGEVDGRTVGHQRNG